MESIGQQNNACRLEELKLASDPRDKNEYLDLYKLGLWRPFTLSNSSRPNHMHLGRCRVIRSLSNCCTVDVTQFSRDFPDEKILPSNAQWARFGSYQRLQWQMCCVLPQDAVRYFKIPEHIIIGRVPDMAPIVAAKALDCHAVNCLELSHGEHHKFYDTVVVNQGSATKIKRVSSLDFAYPKDRPSAQQVWNIFKVKPRSFARVITIPVLERHPYTTQTFVPLGADPATIEFLAVVAEDRDGMPDVATIKAWMCHGGQIVTYGANQWHAPMIVLRGQLNFAVTNAENNTKDDLEEYFFPVDQIPQISVMLPDEASLLSKQRSSML